MTSSPHPPQDFPGLVGLLQARAPRLPPRLRQVAEHMLAHPDDMAFQTVAEIAAGAQVQPSALVRFAQALDYQGFSDLQRVFRSRLKRQNPDHRDRLAALRKRAPSGSAAALFEGFIGAGIASLEQLHERVRPEEIEQAAEILARAETILIVGARRMFPVASYLAYALGKLGLRAILVDQIGAMGAEQAALARPSDVLLAISCAPYTAQTVAIAAEARRAGVPVIAFTDSPLSPLVAHAHRWLEITEADFGDFRSMSASFALALTLAAVTAEKVRPDA